MNKILLGVGAVTALVFTSSSMAIPIPMLSVGFDLDNSGGFETIVDDNGSGDMDVDQNDIVAYLNDWDQINISTVDSNPFNLHMAATMHSEGTVTFGASVVNLTLSDLSTAVFSMGGTGSISSTTSAYLDTDNGKFGTGTLIGTFTGTSDHSFSSSQFEITDADFFSLTLVTMITNGANNTSTVAADINVPEPSIIALFGLGLVGIGFSARRRQAK